MAIYSKLIEGLDNGCETFVKVFTVNPNGRVNNRVDLPFASAILSAFPEEPTKYTQIGSNITASKTFTAPEDGYYKIEVFGASGSGGKNLFSSSSKNTFVSGGGGGGGGCSISVVKMNAGDTINITCGDVGSASSAKVNSSIESYNTLSVTSGANGTQGTAGTTSYPGRGGAGGKASGGQSNYNGGTGSDGACRTYSESTLNAALKGGAGGSPGYSGGNTGGKGSDIIARYGDTNTPETGKKGFVKIYRGNTNIVA